MRKSLFLLSWIILSGIYAQTGGSRIFAYLNIPVSARQAALGGSVFTLTDDVNQAAWNPAVINNNLDGHTSLNYVNYLTDISYLSASGIYMINRHAGSIYGGVTYLNYGTLIAANEQGEETGTFKAYDMAVQTGYAYHIPHTDISLGATFKILNSVIAEFSSIGVAADVGVLYVNKELRFSLGAVMRNAGVQLTTYDGTRESLPLRISIGGSVSPEHAPIRWYWAYDDIQRWQLAYANPSDQEVDFFTGDVVEKKPGFFDNFSRHLSTGVELFPDKGFNLRIGYNMRRGKELRIRNTRTFSGFSFGFGLKFRRLYFDYAYVRYHPATDSHHFGLRINLFTDDK